jgi:hypothetical protein
VVDFRQRPELVIFPEEERVLRTVEHETFVLGEAGELGGVFREKHQLGLFISHRDGVEGEQIDAGCGQSRKQRIRLDWAVANGAVEILYARNSGWRCSGLADGAEYHG